MPQSLQKATKDQLKSSEVKASVWTLKFECPGCGLGTTKTSDSTPKTPPATEWPVCESAVWGTLASGGGHSNMADLFSTICITLIDQPLPHIPSNAVFYARQLWYYVFGVHNLANDQVTIY